MKRHPPPPLLRGPVPVVLDVGLPQVWGADAAGRRRWKAARDAWRDERGLTGPARWAALPDAGWWPLAAASAPTPAEHEARIDDCLARHGLNRGDLPRLAAEARAGWPDLWAASTSPGPRLRRL